MVQVDRDALRGLISKSGRSARAVSLAANLGSTAVKDILSGKSRDPGAATLGAIASQLGVALEDLLDRTQAHGLSEPSPQYEADPRIVPRNLVVRYRAQAGHWFEVEFEEPPSTVSYPVTPDPKFANWPQWLEEVRGDSANRKIAEGKFAHVVDAIEMGYAPQDGNWVVVERRRDQGATRERSIKQIHIRPDGGVELWPRSTNPKWSKPLRLNSKGPRIVAVGGVTPEDGDDVEVEIVGLVIGSYDPDF